LFLIINYQKGTVVGC